MGMFKKIFAFLEMSVCDRSTPDFILSTYITPITQLAKQIQENQSNIDIQVFISIKYLFTIYGVLFLLIRLNHLVV